MNVRVLAYGGVQAAASLDICQRGVTVVQYIIHRALRYGLGQVCQAGIDTLEGVAVDDYLASMDDVHQPCDRVQDRAVVFTHLAALVGLQVQQEESRPLMLLMASHGIGGSCTGKCWS